MPDDQRETLERQKLEAEIAKANLEVAELRKRWFQKPAILFQLIVVLGIIATGIIGHVNGWFSTKLEALHNAQDKAEISLREMNDKRSALDAEIARLKFQVADLTTQRGDLMSQRDTLKSQSANYNAKLKSAQAIVERLSNENKTEGEQCRKALERVNSQLQAASNELSSAQSAKAKSAAWQFGDVVVIRVVLENAGPPSELIVNFPIDDQQALKKAHSAAEYWGSPPDSYDCSGEYGTCTFKVGRASMALGYIAVEAQAAGLSSPEYNRIPNGTRQWTVVMKGHYVGPAS
jgi:DNA repair exonuclease SbcCD ATPase subunit